MVLVTSRGMIMSADIVELVSGGPTVDVAESDDEMMDWGRALVPLGRAEDCEDK